jgi:hypothetical protein
MNRVLLAAALLATAVPAAAQRGPAAAASTLSAEVLTLACAPAIAYQMPDMPLRVTGGQDSFIRRNYAPGDLITINAGTRNGIEVGQEFYVRRVQTANRQAASPRTPGSIRTAGWLRVYAVDETMSLATIEHACDSIEVGDYLEPFALPQMPVVSVDKPKAERDNYARVMPGTDRRINFARGDFFVINRGANQGIAPGAQFVVYRDKRVDQNFLYELGEAIAVDVKPEASTLQVTLARDAVSEGDLVAERKQP